jgi:hypothetical protein
VLAASPHPRCLDEDQREANDVIEDGTRAPAL